MKIMSKRKYRRLFRKIKIDSVLLCYKDTKNYPFCYDYAATVLSIDYDKKTFVTDILNSINPPLTWSETYNFDCKIVKR